MGDCNQEQTVVHISIFVMYTHRCMIGVEWMLCNMPEVIILLKKEFLIHSFLSMVSYCES